jgi:hypothetical protein
MTMGPHAHTNTHTHTHACSAGMVTFTSACCVRQRRMMRMTTHPTQQQVPLCGALTPPRQGAVATEAVVVGAAAEAVVVGAAAEAVVVGAAAEAVVVDAAAEAVVVGAAAEAVVVDAAAEAVVVDAAAEAVVVGATAIAASASVPIDVAAVATAVNGNQRAAEAAAVSAITGSSIHHMAVWSVTAVTRGVTAHHTPRCGRGLLVAAPSARWATHCPFALSMATHATLPAALQVPAASGRAPAAAAAAAAAAVAQPAATPKESAQERLKRLMQAQLNKAAQKDSLASAQKRIQVGSCGCTHTRMGTVWRHMASASQQRLALVCVLAQGLPWEERAEQWD